MYKLLQSIRTGHIELDERRRAAAHLTLVLMGLIAVVCFRSLDSYLSEQQLAQTPAKRSYHSDFGAYVAAAPQAQAKDSIEAPPATFTF